MKKKPVKSECACEWRCLARGKARGAPMRLCGPARRRESTSALLLEGTLERSTREAAPPQLRKASAHK
eukprot:350077-Chlamydomonas_euryale.AAC.12